MGQRVRGIGTYTCPCYEGEQGMTYARLWGVCPSGRAAGPKKDVDEGVALRYAGGGSGQRTKEREQT